MHYNQVKAVSKFPIESWLTDWTVALISATLISAVIQLNKNARPKYGRRQFEPASL